jgi:hypothetical protein
VVLAIRLLFAVVRGLAMKLWDRYGSGRHES